MKPLAYNRSSQCESPLNKTILSYVVIVRHWILVFCAIFFEISVCEMDDLLTSSLVLTTLGHPHKLFVFKL